MIYDEIPNNENHELHEKDCDICGMCLKVSIEKASELYVFTKIYFQCDCGNWIPFEMVVK